MRRRLQYLFEQWNKGGELEVEEVDELKQWQRRWCEKRASVFKFKAQKECFEKDEKCSTFFFQTVKMATAKAVISGLRGQGGELHTDNRGMLGVATSFYRQLFSEQEVDQQWGEHFLGFLEGRVPEEVRAALELPFSKQELWEALKGMSDRKVPGKDGDRQGILFRVLGIVGGGFSEGGGGNLCGGGVRPVHEGGSRIPPL